MKIGKGAFFLLIMILLVSPIVLAGISEWWDKVTGKATTDTATLSVSITNNAPTIYWVNGSFNFDPAEGQNNTVTITFNATDQDGSGNLAQGRMKITNGSVTIENETCVQTLTFGSNNATYECKLQLRYYYQDGTWTINASVNDSSGQRNDNTTAVMIYNPLHAWVMTSDSSDSLNWSTLSTANTNQGATNDPFILNNTGNEEQLEIWIESYNLLGETTPTEWINVSNMSVGPTADGCGQANLVNGTNTNITNLVNTRLDSNRTDGFEPIYFCIEGLPSWLSSQNYSATGYGTGWVISTEQA